MRVRRFTRTRVLAMPMLILLAGACVGGSASGPPRAASPGGDFGSARMRAWVTGAELLERGESPEGPLLDALRRHRPEAFRMHSRGEGNDAQLVVYVGTVRVGGIEVLNMIPVAHVRSVRFLSPNEAMSRFGDTKNWGGAVVVMLAGNR